MMRAMVRRALGALAAAVVTGCGARHLEASTDASARPEAAAVERLGPWFVAHAGQGSKAELSDGAAKAIEAMRVAQRSGASAREVAIAGVVVMEDDPRFNAGTGANLRLDGQTIQCDAAFMDSSGGRGAVAGVDGVRHPIRLAQRVADTPHDFLAGRGANALAKVLGLELRSLVAPEAEAKLRRLWPRLVPKSGEPELWSDVDWRAVWNFESPVPAPGSEFPLDAAPAQEASADTKDTVGTVARLGPGEYAAALSTGGTGLALLGRVGDVPQLGDGLYAGPYGAVAATGKGEAIVRARLAGRVYDRLAKGEAPARAVRLVMRDVTAAEGIGVIAISERGYAAMASSQMAWAAAGVDGGITTAAEVVWQ